MEETTLCYIEKNNKYLMLLRNKENNDINHNKWLGIGGHLEKGETAEEANIREIKEETGLEVISSTKRGVIYFHCGDIHEKMHLFTCSNFKGTEIECDEGHLEWININEVPNLNLWEGDRVFLNLLVEGVEYFELEFFYEKDKMISYKRLK